MTTDQLTVPTVEIDAIRQHPANPRRNAAADDAMVESIRQQGLLDPLMVAPDPEDPTRWILIDGHRRLDGSHKAGLDFVPVNPRYDLVTEAQQIEVMVVTGLQKDLLTPVEEAAAYEQLALAGMDVDDIAAATGFSKKRVQGRLKLNDLSVEARDHLYLGEATLEDAECLLEFADDPETLARLDELFGSHNFRYEVSAARSQRDRRARNQGIIDGFKEQGAKGEAATGDWKSLRSFQGEGHEKLSLPEGHKTCLAWYGDLDSYSEPFLVCGKPSKHKTTRKGDPTDGVEVVSDWEQRQEERARQQAAAEAATAARLVFLREHLLPTKGNSKLAALAKPLVPLLIVDQREAVEERTLFAAFGIDMEAVSWDARLEARTATAASFSTASVANALDGLGSYLAAVVADQLGTDPDYIERPDEAQQHLILWDWLAVAGYTMSDADTAARARLEERLTELDTVEQAQGDNAESTADGDD